MSRGAELAIVLVLLGLGATAIHHELSDPPQVATAQHGPVCEAPAP